MKFEFQTFAYKELELRSQLVEEELVQCLRNLLLLSLPIILSNLIGMLKLFFHVGFVLAVRPNCYNQYLLL